MLEKINTPGFESVSAPSRHAVEALKLVKAAADRPIVAAEVGVGLGASSQEFVRILQPSDELHLFDRERVVVELAADLAAWDEAHGVRIVTHGNADQLFASYSWELAKMVRDAKASRRRVARYDFIYLDGAHAFHHDAAACVLLKKLLLPGGYLVIDDMTWTFAGSPILQKQRELLEQQYTYEQLTTPHMQLVVDVFLRSDRGFEEIELFGEERPLRAVFRRKTRAERADSVPRARRVRTKRLSREK